MLRRQHCLTRLDVSELLNRSRHVWHARWHLGVADFSDFGCCASRRTSACGTATSRQKHGRRFLAVAGPSCGRLTFKGSLAAPAASEHYAKKPHMEAGLKTASCNSRWHLSSTYLDTPDQKARDHGIYNMPHRDRVRVRIFRGAAQAAQEAAAAAACLRVVAGCRALEEPFSYSELPGDVLAEGGGGGSKLFVLGRRTEGGPKRGKMRNRRLLHAVGGSGS